MIKIASTEPKIAKTISNGFNPAILINRSAIKYSLTIGLSCIKYTLKANGDKNAITLVKNLEKCILLNSNNKHTDSAKIVIEIYDVHISSYFISPKKRFVVIQIINLESRTINAITKYAIISQTFLTFSNTPYFRIYPPSKYKTISQIVVYPFPNPKRLSLKTFAIGAITDVNNRMVNKEIFIILLLILFNAKFNIGINKNSKK